MFTRLTSSFQKIKNALFKTSSKLGSSLRALFNKPLDEDTFTKLEQALYEADLGVKTASELTEKIHALHKQDPKISGDALLKALTQEIATLLSQYPSGLQTPKVKGPLVILIVGVNGNGKTTTTAKLAHHFKSQGKKVLIAAADTFRAAAVEQLEIWSEKMGVELVKGASKSDPSAVTFDAMQAALAREIDVVLIDTAGRLHTKIPLMQELEKLRRTCKKLIPEAPHETLMILDATTGQNGIDQAAAFHQYTPITGLVLTKLDGTAKGGIAIRIQQQLGIPIKFLGVGEDMKDLELFDPQSFSEALFGELS